MNIVGIIAEYNPLHRGHVWQIAETRRALGADCGVVCAMSGNWVQRGECALTDKWTRAAMALRGGVDLVLELPTVWATSSAESFARGGVGVLCATGLVDTISFGSESGDLEELRVVSQCLETPGFRETLRTQLNRGLSFAAARQNAVADLLGPAAECLTGPNNNLAVEYLRALPPGMEALAVRRVGAGHDGGPAGGYASASVIREWLREGKMQRAEDYLPEPWQGDIASMEWCERAILARLRSLSLEELERLPDSGEGLAARLLEAARKGRTLEEVFALAKTKRYAHARIRRLALWAFLGLTAADRPARVPYLRVLGFTDRGRTLLREMEGRAAVPILTKAAHGRRLDREAARLLELEARCTDLYGLCFAEPWEGGREWTSGPVRLLNAQGMSYQ